MTLNGVMAAIVRYFTKFGTFRGKHTQKWLQICLNFLRQKCSPKLELSLPPKRGTATQF